MQLRRLAALRAPEDHRRLAEIEGESPTSRTSSPTSRRQRQIVTEELAEIVEKYGDDRRTQIIAADGDLSMEDLIPDEELVVSITRGGYAKRTRADQYRSQKRGGKGVRGATLRGDDVVEHFIATTNHHWLLFFTTAGRVYRTKAYNLPEAQRDAKGGHVAGLLSFQPDENIAQVLAIRDYEQAPYLVLATRNGLVKKTRLGDYNSPRQAGVIAINFREDDDELIGAELVFPEDEILLVSRKGQAVRFRADDSQLRPMGRATSGVSGMKYAAGDSVLSMSVIRAAVVAAEEAEGPRTPRIDVKVQYVFTMTDGGFAKRTRTSEYRLTNRGTKGVKAMTLANEARGVLVGAFIVEEGDEVLSITAERPGRAQPDQRGLPAHRALDDGREVRDAQGRRLGRRRDPLRRGQGRGGRGRPEEGADEDADVPAGETPAAPAPNRQMTPGMQQSRTTRRLE